MTLTRWMEKEDSVSCGWLAAVGVHGLLHSPATATGASPLSPNLSPSLFQHDPGLVPGKGSTSSAPRRAALDPERALDLIEVRAMGKKRAPKKKLAVPAAIRSATKCASDKRRRRPLNLTSFSTRRRTQRAGAAITLSNHNSQNPRAKPEGDG